MNEKTLHRSIRSRNFYPDMLTMHSFVYVFLFSFYCGGRFASILFFLSKIKVREALYLSENLQIYSIFYPIVFKSYFLKIIIIIKRHFLSLIINSAKDKNTHFIYLFTLIFKNHQTSSRLSELFGGLGYQTFLLDLHTTTPVFRTFGILECSFISEKSFVPKH